MKIAPRFVIKTYDYISSKNPEDFPADLFVPKRMSNHYYDSFRGFDSYEIWTFYLKDKEKELVENDVSAEKYVNISLSDKYSEDSDYFFEDNFQVDEDHDLFCVMDKRDVLPRFMILYDKTDGALYYFYKTI